MLFKLVLTFIAAAHCLPTGYNKHAKSAERLHALEKELDALKHVAEPQMERRGAKLLTCLDQCDSLFGDIEEEATTFFYEKVDIKWKQNTHGATKRTINRFYDAVKTHVKTLDSRDDTTSVLVSRLRALRACKSFCKVVD